MYEGAEHLCTAISRLTGQHLSGKREAGPQDYKDILCDLPLPQSNMQNGETFLMRAAKDNSSEMVENLLKYRADPNRQDKVH